MLMHELLKDIETGLPNDAILDSVYEVEDVLIAISDIDRKIEHLKGLKDYRMKSINAELEKLENQELVMRDLISRSLKQLQPDQKTFHFPAVGKVTRRTTSDSWEVIDEQAVLSSLQKIGLKSRVVETKEIINKKELKKVVSELTNQNQSIAGVALKEGTDSISITFEDRNVPLPKKTSTSQKTIDDLDALESQV